MTTINALINHAADLMAGADLSALQSESRFGALQVTREDVEDLWAETKAETRKKRRSRAIQASMRWAAAAKFAPELITLSKGYTAGEVAESDFDKKLIALAIDDGVYLDDALTLSSWLEAIAEKGAASAAGQATESVSKLTAKNKNAKRAKRTPRQPTASAKGAAVVPEVAATVAGAHRPAATVDSASSEEAAAADAATTAMLAAIAQAMELASAAPDVATATAIMAAQWARAVGVTLPQ